jgi:D-tyrosyl-tRNA(Tyr) deacylase|tara:strand:- start:814 stop:1251 length:438 start_codon:yes stop_codon:yes gene_type:complete
LKLLIQRVSQASVKIDDQNIASIANGILVFVGFDPSDTAIEITKLTNKLLNYKVFNDTRGRVSLSVIEAKAEVLLVPQVTLAVKTNKGLKPSFSGAADPEKGLELFKVFKDHLQGSYSKIQAGKFGANMSVSLINEGPITYWFEV